MTEQQLSAVKQALELMHNRGDVGVDEWIAAEAAIKQVIAQDALEKMAEESRTSGLRLDDWDKIGCVNHDCDQCRGVQEPVAHQVIAGALFDFMGWLTSRNERLVLSSTDDASPAVEAITEFAKMRGLSLDGARVQDWQNTTPPAQPAVQREHITDGRQCWCSPDIDYVDPETGAAVIVHKEPQ
jgi:hypothetical protein